MSAGRHVLGLVLIWSLLSAAVAIAQPQTPTYAICPYFAAQEGTRGRTAFTETTSLMPLERKYMTSEHIFLFKVPRSESTEMLKGVASCEYVLRAQNLPPWSSPYSI